jgi:hypothetical protein
VTPGITKEGFSNVLCSSVNCSSTTGGNALVQRTVCCDFPGIVPDKTRVTLEWTDDPDDPDLDVSSNDTIRIKTDFLDNEFFIIGDSPWPWSHKLEFSVDATMRYE